MVEGGKKVKKAEKERSVRKNDKNKDMHRINWITHDYALSMPRAKLFK